MNRKLLRYFRPAIFIFLFLNIGFFTLQKSLDRWGFNQELLVYGNILLFAVCFISFIMGANGLQSKNNQAFFRWVYGSFIVKLFLLVVVAFIYIISVKKNINKPALFFCLALYIVYTAIEVTGLMKMAKQKNNA